MDLRGVGEMVGRRDEKGGRDSTGAVEDEEG